MKFLARKDLGHLTPVDEAGEDALRLINHIDALQSRVDALTAPPGENVRDALKATIRAYTKNPEYMLQCSESRLAREVIDNHAPGLAIDLLQHFHIIPREKT